MEEMAYIRGKNDINRHIRYGNNNCSSSKSSIKIKFLLAISNTLIRGKQMRIKKSIKYGK